MRSIIKQEFTEHLNIGVATMESLAVSIETSAKICIKALKNQKKILLFGNGGSAADAQHIAAELIGRYKTNRQGLPAIAITTDTSVITSISNDFGYHQVFNRQLEALANKEDVVIGISTSGSSQNVISALSIAQKIGCKTIGMTGQASKKMNKICDVTLEVPSADTARIQEMHIVIGHTICHLIDNAFDKN